MKGFLKFKKRDMYIVITFLMIILTLSICVSIIYSEVEKNKEKNGISSGNSKYFNFTKPDSINSDDLIKEVEKYKDIYLEYNPIPIYRDITTTFGKSAYSNKEDNNPPPILEGRYFDLEELSSNINNIVIGSDLKQYLEKNGKFKVGEKEFNVIGIMGDKTGKSAYDEMFIIPMKSLNIKSDERCQWKVIGDKKNIENILSSIESSIKGSGNQIIIKEPIYKLDMKQIIKDMWDFISIFLLTCVIGLLNITLIMQFWIKGYTKEIGLRKTLGGSSGRIILEIFVKYQLILLTSFVLGSAIHYALQDLFNNMFSYINPKFTINNIIIVYISSMILGLITGVIPIIKAIITKPSISIKGNK